MQTLEPNVLCFDNGGQTIDRYTVLYLTTLDRGVIGGRGMSANPSHPMGCGEWFEIPFYSEYGNYSHLGESVPFGRLPGDCQKLVKWDLEDINKEVNQCIM